MATIKTIHYVFASLFLLDFLVKTILLLWNKSAQLEKYKKIGRIPGMIISTAFLLSGIYLVANIGMGNIGGWFHLKLLLVIVGIALGIIAFKKNSKMLAVITSFLFLYVFAISESKDIGLGAGKEDVSSIIENSADPEYDAVLHGKKIYVNLCFKCHGGDGDKGLTGSTFLSTSVLADDSLIHVISQGRGTMEPYSDQLSEYEIQVVAEYVKTLRN